MSKKREKFIMPTQEGYAKAFDLIIDLTMELLIDFDLAPEVHKRVDLIQALAKHRYDIRSTPEREQMEEWRRRFDESEESEESVESED